MDRSKRFAKAPSAYRLGTLAKMLRGDGSEAAQVSIEINGKYYPARSEGYFSLRSRLWHAWEVFTGRADILYWPQDYIKRES